MRFDPTKLLHGLLYSTPVILLTLAACGGGGGGSTPTTPPLAAAYTVGGAASGVLGTGVTLRNNGGDDLLVAANATSYTFNTSVVAGARYNVTVLTHPTSPTQRCSVTAASGVMPSSNVTGANVSCITAFTVSADITNATGSGLVLQNNGGDNLLIPASGIGVTQTFAFNTPLLNGDNYTVTVLTQPHTPNQDCTPHTTGNLTVTNANQTVTITCGLVATPPPPDPYVFVANFGSDNIWAYAASGVPSAPAVNAAGDGPYSIAVDPAGQFAYVVNFNADTVSAYNITAGALSPLDMDALTAGVQNTIATGNAPRAIAIDPSGKFAYVVNYLDNSVSAYSIDAAGVLARIDSNGATTANETSIPTRSGPVSIAINPAGGYAYVANVISNEISAYSIDPISGALTPIAATNPGTNPYISTYGTAPSALTIDPSGQHLYVTNANSADIMGYHIDPTYGFLTEIGTPLTTGGTNPHAVAIHPNGGYAYVVNTGSNNIGIYSLLAGAPQPPPTPVGTGGTSPLSITIDSTGQYAYVANSGSNDISAFSISGGTLTRILCSSGTCSPAGNFPAGTSPYSVITSK